MLAIIPAQKPIKTISNNVAIQVYRQLIPDFPGHAIDWVKHTHWIGPVAVPLESIDTSNRANWTASHEPAKVKKHLELIKEGISKPIILGKFPQHDKYIIIDAHHRFLAYEALGQKPIAYIGTILPQDVEKALHAHSMQYTGGSKLNGT